MRVLFALAFLLLALALLSAMRILGLLWRRMRPSSDISCSGIGEAVLRAAPARPAPRDPELDPDQPATAAVQVRSPPGATRSVLSASTRRELLDAAPLCANPRAHRATRVAPHLIASLTRGASAMRSGAQTSRGVSRSDGRGRQTQKQGVGHGPCLVRLTSGNVSGRANEPTDGMVRSFNATAEGKNRSISEITVQSLIIETPPRCGGGSRQTLPKRRKRDGC